MTSSDVSHGRVAIRALVVLRRLQEGSATKEDLKTFLQRETGEIPNERTLRRSLEYVRRAGFAVRKERKYYCLDLLEEC